MRRVFLGGFTLLLLACAAVQAQVQTPAVQPIPIPGGDVVAEVGIFNAFFPGVGAGYDDPNSDPNGITNFKGHVAMGYTLGTATDNKGNQYAVITDIRVYQGDYIGGVPTFGAGGTTSAKAHRTFVEI